VACWADWFAAAAPCWPFSLAAWAACWPAWLGGDVESHYPGAHGGRNYGSDGRGDDSPSGGTAVAPEDQSLLQSASSPALLHV